MKRYLIPILVFLGLFYYTYASSWDARRAMRPKFSVPQQTSTRPVIDWEGELGEGTFTRNSPVNYWGTDGVMHSGVTDEEVFQCVGMSGTTPAYNCADCELAGLREPASTNSILGARDCDNATYWTVEGGMSATQDQTGLFGDANSGVSCSDTSDTAAQGIVQVIALPNDDDPVTYSVHIKKDDNEARFPELRAYFTGGTGAKSCYLRINTKTGNSDVASSAGTYRYGVHDCGDWWRWWISVDNDSSGDTNFHVKIYPSLATTLGGAVSTAPTGTIIVDGIQVELNTKVPSSFIDTQGSPVTRATTSGYPRYTLPTNTFAESLGSELLTASDDRDFTVWENVHWSGYSGGVLADGGGKMQVTMDTSGHCGAILSSNIAASTIGTLYKLELDVWQGTTTKTDFRMFILDAVSGLQEFFITVGAAQTTYSVYFTAQGTDFDFYIDCLDSDNGTFFVDNATIKPVTNARNDQPCPGTAVIWWRPGFDYGDSGAVSSGIFAVTNSTDSLIRTKHGHFYSSDATSGVNAQKFNVNWTKGNWYKIVVQWGYLTSNVAKKRIGCDSGSGISWGTAIDYGGSYTIGSYIHIAYELYGPMHTKRLAIFDRILSDAEINAMGSPSN